MRNKYKQTNDYIFYPMITMLCCPCVILYNEIMSTNNGLHNVMPEFVDKINDKLYPHVINTMEYINYVAESLKDSFVSSLTP